jgi:hypothetical protein
LKIESSPIFETSLESELGFLVPFMFETRIFEFSFKEEKKLEPQGTWLLTVRFSPGYPKPNSRFHNQPALVRTWNQSLNLKFCTLFRTRIGNENFHETGPELKHGFLLLTKNHNQGHSS